MARLILSAGIIFGVLAAVAAASSALLQTNNATAATNTFSVASGDILQIAPDVNNGPGTYSTNLTNAFNAAGMLPGDTRQFKFWLKNTTADNIQLHLFGNLANYVFSGDTDLNSKMKVQFLCDVINTGDDGNTPEQTLSTWTTSPTTGKKMFDQGGTAILGTTPTTNQAQCTMKVTLDSSSTDAGDSVQFDAIFNGEQVAPSST